MSKNTDGALSSNQLKRHYHQTLHAKGRLSTKSYSLFELAQQTADKPLRHLLEGLSAVYFYLDVRPRVNKTFRELLKLKNNITSKIEDQLSGGNHARVA
jgi:ABC-type dipeptide/oligopeptide/nickel transport system ATPase subunit